MIGLLFKFAGEVIEIRIVGEKIIFRKSPFYAFVPIEGIQLSKFGVTKEFPDLKDHPDWRSIAIQRFKQKMREYKTETDRAKYLIQDLNNFGYSLLWIQREGFRPTKQL